ncbi:NIPSNAP family protein [candidate division KSB1 bacterium]|nr:NIPSNAP family protein [candidate division KSB1 bacterium]
MKRREFLATSILAGGASVVPAFSQELSQMYYEFSRYQIVNNAGKIKFENYWEQAAIPALNRLGIQPVGLLQSKYGSHGLDYYVLVPHPSLDSFVTVWENVAADAEYQSLQDFIDQPMTEPLYYRCQTSLLRAFAELPTIEIAPHIRNAKGRLFEMRIYESHNRHTAKLKVEMFNQGGEIALFRETGLNPVLFGETLAGDRMPNLTYMLGFASIEERDKAWQAFGGSEAWATMRVNPRYADTVSSVTDIILSPAACSQI